MGLIGLIPWNEIKTAYHLVQENYLTYEATPTFEAEICLERAESLLVQEHFAPWDTFSYEAEDEVLNMRRIESTEYRNGQKFWFQTHVRVFDVGEGTLGFAAHRELCPIQHPEMHYDEEWLTVAPAEDTIRGILEDNGFDTTSR